MESQNEKCVDLTTHENKVNELLTRINSLNSTLESCQAKNRDYANKVDNLKDYLIENRDDLGEHAEAIADIFGIKLTKTYDVSVTVIFTATIESEEEPDESDLQYNVTPSMYWGFEVIEDNYEVTEASVEEQ